MSAEDLEGQLVALLRQNAPLMRALRLCRDLHLPDWMIFSGAVYQTVFNHRSGLPLTTGLKDYDLAYYDASDLSYEAEDVVIRRVRAALPEDLKDLVEVRNQARVHLWFEGHFGEPYAPLPDTPSALSRFLSPCFAVGVRMDAGDQLTVLAPFGLEDVFNMVVRPNPMRGDSRNFDRVAAGVQARWPQVTVRHA